MRKQQGKVKDGAPEQPSLGEYYPDALTTNSSSSGSYQPTYVAHNSYAVAQQPRPFALEESGIPKSAFRSVMEKKTGDIRKTIAKTFGGKKKNEEQAESLTSRGNSSGSDVVAASISGDPHFVQFPPPQGQLPALPATARMKCWAGSGKQAVPWNKLHRDPELWDPNGDTLVFLNGTNIPSFRLSSHMLQRLNSPYLNRLLHESFHKKNADFSQLPSQIDQSYSSRPGQSFTPPISTQNSSIPDGQVSYQLFLAPAAGQPGLTSTSEILQDQMTTRNVFALIYQASLVGFNFYQALETLQGRLETWGGEDENAVQRIIDWIVGKSISDLRNRPDVAIGILVWSELNHVCWHEGWLEAYAHCAGMYERVSQHPDFQFVSGFWRNKLDMSNLGVQGRVFQAQKRLGDFNFENMWPPKSSCPSKVSFDRFRKFLISYYQQEFGTWPPACQSGEELWLTRLRVKHLQDDFAALYDYLVDRKVTWDGREDRSGRKWNLVRATDRKFNPDAGDLSFTDLIVQFDNQNQIPHIPHPYPLVPASVHQKTSKDGLFKIGKVSGKSGGNKNVSNFEEKMAVRKAGLDYVEATNANLLGSNASNRLVSAFADFEKIDLVGEIDPFAARRGRWILLYGILQSLAAVSVDAPNLIYTQDVVYHLCAKYEGIPTWAEADGFIPEHDSSTRHTQSYCWAVHATWSNAPVLRGQESKDEFNHGPFTGQKLDNNGLESGRHVIPRIQHRPVEIPPSLITSFSGSNESFTGDSIQPSQSASNGRINPRYEPSVDDSIADVSSINYPGHFADFSSTGYAPGIEKLDDSDHDTNTMSTVVVPGPLRMASQAQLKGAQPLRGLPRDDRAILPAMNDDLSSLALDDSHVATQGNNDSWVTDDSQEEIVEVRGRQGYADNRRRQFDRRGNGAANSHDDGRKGYAQEPPREIRSKKSSYQVHDDRGNGAANFDDDGRQDFSQELRQVRTKKSAYQVREGREYSGDGRVKDLAKNFQREFNG